MWLSLRPGLCTWSRGRTEVRTQIAQGRLQLIFAIRIQVPWRRDVNREVEGCHLSGNSAVHRADTREQRLGDASRAIFNVGILETVHILYKLWSEADSHSAISERLCITSIIIPDVRVFADFRIARRRCLVGLVSARVEHPSLSCAVRIRLPC